MHDTMDLDQFRGINRYGSLVQDSLEELDVLSKTEIERLSECNIEVIDILT